MQIGLPKKINFLLVGLVFLTSCVSASLDDAGLTQSALSTETQNEVQNEVQNSALEQGATQAPVDLTNLRTGGPATSSLNGNNLEAEPNVAAIETIQTQTSGDVAPAPTGPTANVSTGEISNPNEITPAQRQQGISEIREKAALTGSQQPDINATRIPATKHFTKQEKDLKIAELQAEALAASGQISDEELLLRKKRIALMRKTARTHYKQALKQIVN